MGVRVTANCGNYNTNFIIVSMSLSKANLVAGRFWCLKDKVGLGGAAVEIGTGVAFEDSGGWFDFGGNRGFTNSATRFQG
jgi:hypothetical protein